MAGRFAVRTCGLAFALAFGCECALSTEAADRTLTNGSQQAQEIRIRLQRDYLVFAPGSIGGAHNLNFLVDTGTVPSLISRKLAQKLELQGPEVEIGIWGARTKVILVTLPVMQLGPLKVENLKVFAIDMQPMEQ